MFSEWINGGDHNFIAVIVSAAVTYAAILLFTRLAGLRSFSKMSAADFAMTVAVGSLFASTISSAEPSLLIGIAALFSLFVGQWTLAWLRRRSRIVSRLIDNEPLLLMRGSIMIDENLRRANVTRSDVYGKLREANAITYDQVLAVVFETTGDISVLHSDDPAATLEPDFLQNVVGAERLFTELTEPNENSQ
ncbi:MAG: DUF421 domain-containing protein [Planctomycetaceae bacterium]|nr:DUF421 domain-containing protein [Planctomycetaceae bacterium]